MSTGFRQSLFRTRDGEGGSRVTNIELFFDLVFVFAITQLSHLQLAHMTLVGAVETLVLFCAVWWLWIYTSWATNWLDPERPLVRGLLIAMMTGALVLSTTLPDAFGARGLVFALTYVGLQLGRSLVIAWAARGHHPARMRNFLRISFYFVLSAPLWIAGAYDEGMMRIAWWVAALTIEYAGPWLFFWTPGLGRSQVADWDISGAHTAERCSLFIIIALGEAIVVTGATFSGLILPVSANIAALITCTLASAVMWWIYFDTGPRAPGAAIEDGDTGRIARNAYTYWHMPIVAGIVITAVGDEIMLTHPDGHADLGFVLVACGGPFLFLLGNQAFKWMTAGRRTPPLSHFIGEVLLAGIAVEALRSHWVPLTIGMAAVGALLTTAVWEWFSLHGGWQRWAPWIGRPTVVALEDSER